MCVSRSLNDDEHTHTEGNRPRSLINIDYVSLSLASSTDTRDVTMLMIIIGYSPRSLLCGIFLSLSVTRFFFHLPICACECQLEFISRIPPNEDISLFPRSLFASSLSLSVCLILYRCRWIFLCMSRAVDKRGEEAEAEEEERDEHSPSRTYLYIHLSSSFSSILRVDAAASYFLVGCHRLSFLCARDREFRKKHKKKGRDYPFLF